MRGGEAKQGFEHAALFRVAGQYGPAVGSTEDASYR